MYVKCFWHYGSSKLPKRLLAAVTLVVMLLSGGLLSPVLVRAGGTTISWTGTAGDGKWETPSNWNLGRVPLSGDIVVISATNSVNCDVETPSITLQCAGSLTVSNGGTVNLQGDSVVSGSLVNNGKMVVQSGQLTPSGGGTGSGGFDLRGTAHLKLAGGKSYTFDGNVDDLGDSGSLTVADAGTTATFNGPCEAATTSVNMGASAIWNGTTSIKAFNNFGNAVFNSDITLYTLYSTGTIGGSGNITVSKSGSSFYGWRGGTIEGTGTLIVGPTGAFLLTGDSEKNLNRKLINNGSVNVMGGTAKFNKPVENLGRLSISKDCTQVSMYKGYAQTEAGSLSFDIAGDNAFKHIEVAQTLSLAGELHVTLVNNYVPAAGTAFKLLGYPAGIAPGPGNRFTTVTSSNIGINLEATYNSSDLTLTVARADQVVAPTANPAAGTYTETQNVVLTTTTDGATIHYTTDGSEPTTGSAQYTSAIQVAASTTIKAIAVKAGMANSPVAIFAYVIQEPADEAPPVVETFTPGNMASNVALETDALVLKFNEPVWGVSNKALSIYEKQSNWKAADVFAQSSDNAVMTGNGTTTVTFNISSVALKLGKEYYISIAQGAFKDAAGNEYAGISDNTTWTFKVEDDTQVPTVPTNLRCVSRTANAVELAWDASTDDHGPIRYHIHVKNGSQYDFVAESDTSSFTVSKLDESTPLIPNTTYTFVTRALDGSNNVSGYSSELAVATLGVASSEAKITAFSFEEQTGPANINLDAGTIAIEVPYGTNVANLVATFTLSAGASAKVGGVDQVSGTTSNDFTNPVIYTVIAEDGSSTKNWTVTVTVAAPTEFAGGDGTEESPYLVETAAHLNNVRNHLDKHFKQIADIDLDVEPYNAGGWIPIGKWLPVNAEPFLGTFDGNGYTISNLYVNRLNLDDVGLFGYIDGAEIRSVKLENVDVAGKMKVGSLVGRSEGLSQLKDSSATGSVKGHGAVGGLVGYNENGTIISCFAECTVTGNNVGEFVSYGIGGLVGNTWGNNLTCRIADCYANGVVTGENSVGGLAGYSANAIANSYATGTVIGKKWVGGLAGTNRTRVTDSYSTCVVSGEANVGGLVGYNYGDSGPFIADCHAKGTVTGNEYVGGLVGYNGMKFGSITSSYATGSVTGGSHVGGLVGENQNRISDCYYTGDMVKGEYTVGGLVGSNTEAEDYGNTFPAIIERSYATANVLGTSLLEGGTSFGGLVGYNKGTITSTYALGFVTGRTWVGGLVGSNSGPISHAYARGNATGTDSVGGLVGAIEGNAPAAAECYSTGAVTGTGGEPKKLGGLVGAASELTVERSYWDTEASGMVVSAAGEGRNTTLMRNQATYTDWNFTEIWDIASDKNDGYPFLRCLEAGPVDPDAHAVAADMATLIWNVIKGANSSQTNVISNLVLPTSGANGTTISWAVQPAGYVNQTSGAVTRPESDVGDVNVTLTATISKGSASDTKAFNLVIKAKPAPYVPGPGPSPEPPPSTPPSRPTSIITALASTAADRLLDQSLLASGKAELSLADLAGNRLTISTAVIRQLAERGLFITLRTENMTIVIDPAALLLEQITEWGKGKAWLEITVEEVVGEDLQALLEQWQAPTRNGRFHVQGNIYQVGVELWEAGQESGQTIEQLAQAITVMQHSPEGWSDELLAQLRVGLSNTDESKLIWLELTPDMDTRSVTFSTDLMGHFVTGWLELPTFVIDLGIESSAGVVNGVENTMDVPPAIINDRTMVPARFVAQAMGARVDWLAATRTVRIRLDGKVVELVIGQTDPDNGLDVPAQIVSNRTLVPLRFVSESLGAFVRWLPKTRSVEIVMFAPTLK